MAVDTSRWTAHLRHTWHLFKTEPFAIADLAPYFGWVLLYTLAALTFLIICLVVPAPWGGFVGALFLTAWVADQGLRAAERRHAIEDLIAEVQAEAHND